MFDKTFSFKKKFLFSVIQTSHIIFRSHSYVFSLKHFLSFGYFRILILSYYIVKGIQNLDLLAVYSFFSQTSAIPLMFVNDETPDNAFFPRNTMFASLTCP